MRDLVLGSSCSTCAAICEMPHWSFFKQWAGSTETRDNRALRVSSKAGVALFCDQ